MAELLKFTIISHKTIINETNLDRCNGFGLVNIPVKIYSATSTSNLDLHMLDKKDNSHIKYQRINENTGKVVEWNNIVKGSMLDGSYVILEDKDYEKASPEKTKTIDISDFVLESEISSMYYEAPYYLEPDKSGTRPYELLRQALLKTKKVGVASFVMRSKESMAILRPDKGARVLNRIRFEQEIRSTDDLALPKNTEVKPAELKMAITLIDQLSGKFDISKYKETYNDTLLELIKAKAKGKTMKVIPMKAVQSKTVDLMEQLKASLVAKKKKAS